MAKYDFNFKLKIVRENELGYGRYYLSEKYNVKEGTIRNWIEQYKSFGEDGLKKSMSKTKYSGEFKLSVLQYRKIHRLSYRETADHFKIRNGSIIANWQRIYDEKGIDGLFSKIGRPKKSGESKVENKETKEFKATTESEKEELLRLREENMYLKAENLYLKKLRALIHEKELKTKKKR